MLIEGHLKRWRDDDDDDVDDDALLLWSHKIKAVWHETKGGRDTNVTAGAALPAVNNPPTPPHPLRESTNTHKKNTHLHIWPRAYFRGDTLCEQAAGAVV